MKILSWNVRGLGGVEKRRYVKECLWKYHLDMVIFQETKKDKIVPLLIRSLVGQNSFEWIDIPVVGVAGGMLMIWNPAVVRKVEDLKGEFSIAVRFVEISSGFDWMFSGVYGSCSPYSRNRFWEELSDIRGYWTGPWIVGEDFNVIRFAFEKNIGSRVTRSMRDFGNFVNDCAL